jgi:hypothetical protein
LSSPVLWRFSCGVSTASADRHKSISRTSIGHTFRARRQGLPSCADNTAGRRTSTEPPQTLVCIVSPSLPRDHSNQVTYGHDVEKLIMETSDRTIIVCTKFSTRALVGGVAGLSSSSGFPSSFLCQEIEPQRRNVSTVASPRHSLIALYSHMDQQATL